MAEARFSDPGYKNWSKCTYGLQLIKEGVSRFLEDTSKRHHDSILRTLSQHGQCVNKCSTEERAKNCPVCKLWMDSIKASKKGQLIWKNAKPYEWFSNNWEVAKVYMGRGQDKGNKNGPADIDTSALLQLMSNNKFYIDILTQGDKKAKYEKQIKDVIEIRNKVMHAPSLSLPENDFLSYIDTFLAVLKIPAIDAYSEARTSRTELEKLKAGGFDVTVQRGAESIEVVALKAKMEEIKQLLLNGASPGTEQALPPDQVKAIQGEFVKFMDGNADLKASLRSDLQELRVEIRDLRGPMAALSDQISQLSDRLETGGGSAAVSDFDPTANYVADLNHRAQKNGWDLKIDYEQPNHKGWVGIAKVDGKEYRSSNEYRDVKTAKQEAAYQALRRLIDARPKATSQVSPEGGTRQANEGNASPSAVAPSRSSVVASGKDVTELERKLRIMGCVAPDYTTSRDGNQYSAHVKINIPYLWSVESCGRGKKVAEQEAAKLISDDLGLPPGKSPKETMKGYCDKNKEPQIKYYSYKSPTKEQEFYSVAYFKGKPSNKPVTFHGPLCQSESESFNMAAKLVLDALAEMSVESQGLPQAAAENQPSVATAASPLSPQSEAHQSDNINYVSKLNEFVQKAKLEKPQFDVEESSDKKSFRCKITWPKPWLVEVSHDPSKTFASKKEAEKYAAQTVLKQHFSVDATVEDSKNKLNELFQKKEIKTNPKYESQETTDKKFTATVSFEVEKAICGDWCDSKKRAKDDAARVAYEKLVSSKRE